MIAARILLIGVGVAVAGYGVVLLVTTLSHFQLIAVALWLIAMIVVHDAVLAPLTSALHARWYRRAQTRPTIITVTVHIGFAVGGTLTLFVVPEIWAQGRGNANPTILVGDYALRLVLVWALIAVIVLVVVRVALRQSRR